MNALADEPRLERMRINFSWILKLRWLAAAGQLATIVLVRSILGVELPTFGLMSILAFEALSNTALEGWFRGVFRRGESPPTPARLEIALGTVMMVDIALLSALLYLTGGPTNPFAVFFLVNIVLSAVVLSARWTAAICALGLLCFATLFVFHLPLPELDHMDYAPARGDPRDFTGRTSLFLRGWIAAFCAAAMVIATFVARVTAELRRREQELGEEKRRQAERSHLESLATLAAGAAHELSTPLSTIALVARELELALMRRLPDGGEVEDARLIRSEVARCRAILDQMAADAGQSAGEEFAPFTIPALVDQAIANLVGRERVDVTIGGEERERSLKVPGKALALALRQVVKNALDASAAPLRVELRVEALTDRVQVDVRDRGAGMSDETIARATDPFFTTKEPGKGMGLGLFLTRMVVERLDGRMRFHSVEGSGTTVRVVIPPRYSPPIQGSRSSA